MSDPSSLRAQPRPRVEDVIITDELARRPSRLPDHEGEARTLRELADVMARDAGALLQSIAAAAMALTRSGSAGISLLEADGTHGAFRWVAASGVLARHRGGTLPPSADPSSAAVARNAILLLREPGRVFPPAFEVGASVHETLLAPFEVDARPAGTVWAVKHDPHERFEREDARLLEGLARFAAAVHGIVQALHGAQAASRRSGAELAARLADAELLQRLSTSLISEREPGVLYEESLTAAMALMRSDAASLQVLAPEGDRLVLLAARNLHPESVARWHVVDASGATPCGRSLLARARVVVEDAEADPAFVSTQDLEEFRRSGIRAAQSTPLVARCGRPVGLISTHWRAPRRLEESDFRLLDVLARQLADLLDRATAEAARREDEAGQALLLALSDAVRTIGDPAGIEAVAMRMLGEHLGLARTYYFDVERDERGWVHVVDAAYQREPDQPSMVGRHSLSRFGPEMFEGFARGEVIAVGDVSALPALTPAELASYRVLGVAAFINVPFLKHEGYSAGIGAHDTAPRSWTAAEIALIRQVGERTWLAVERTRAEAALRGSAARFRALATAGSYSVYRMSSDWTRMHQLDGRSFLADTGETMTSWADQYIPPEEMPRVSAAIQAAIRDTSLFELEHRVRRADGGIGWVLSRAVPILDEDGRVVEWFGAGSDITARKDAEQKARQSEELRRIALEGGGMGAWQWSRREGLIRGDARFLALWGLPPSDAAHPFADFTRAMSQDSAAQMQAMASRAIAAGESFDGELEIVSGPTAGRWVHWRGRADNQDPLILHGVSFDVTEQKRAITALRESEEALAAELADAELLRGLAERLVTEESVGTIYDEILSAAVAVARSDAGAVQIYDPATGSLTLLNSRTFPSEVVDRFLSVDANGRTACGAALRTGQRAIVDLADETGDPGCLLLVEAGFRTALAIPLVSRTGRQLGMLNVHWHAQGHRPGGRQLRFLDLIARQAADLIEQRQAQAVLRESEERLRQFGEASLDILWIRDAQTLQWTYLTPAFEAIYGLGRKEALRDDNYRAWQDLIVPQDRDHVAASIRRVAAGERVTFEYRIRRPVDGQVRWLRDTDFPMRDAAGRVVRIGGVGHDVTALKAVQAAMAASETRLRTMLEGIPQLVWRSGADGLWTWASPQWMAFTGQRQEESHGRGWLGAVHPDDQESAMQAWDEALPHGTLDTEFRVRRASDGAWLWHRTRSVPVREAEGTGARIVEWLGTTTDIDDLKRLQGEQQVLVAELQHRTRNLLSVVRNVARRSFGASPERDEYDSRLAAIGRVQGFLSRSQGYSVPLADVVEAELHAVGDGASSKVDIAGPPVDLPGESVQAVALALHELATNAVKYGALAQPSGRLAVAWCVEADGKDGQCLVIDWQESGVAMPDGPPSRRGYGTELITRALPYQLRAETALEFTPDGVWCRITLPAGTFHGRGEETRG